MVPEEAVTVAVSLDGVMVPMKDVQRAEKRERSRAQSRRAKGPTGYQEAGCATLSFYDGAGERLDYQYAEFRIMPRVVLNWLIPFASCLVFSA